MTETSGLIATCPNCNQETQQDRVRAASWSWWVLIGLSIGGISILLPPLIFVALVVVFFGILIALVTWGRGTRVECTECEFQWWADEDDLHPSKECPACGEDPPHQDYQTIGWFRFKSHVVTCEACGNQWSVRTNEVVGSPDTWGAQTQDVTPSVSEQGDGPHATGTTQEPQRATNAQTDTHYTRTLWLVAAVYGLAVIGFAIAVVGELIGLQAGEQVLTAGAGLILLAVFPYLGSLVTIYQDLSNLEGWLWGVRSVWWIIGAAFLHPIVMAVYLLKRRQLPTVEDDETTPTD